MAAVEHLGIHPVELAHALRKIGFRILYHDVVAIAHQAVGMAAPVQPLAHPRKIRNPR